MSEWGNKDLANNAPKYLNYNHPGNTNVYMVNAGRIANSGAIGESVVHQGWVKVYPGKGSLKTITFDTSSLTANTYSSANLVFTGTNDFPAKGNVVITGTGLSSSVTVNINDPGKGYSDKLVITADSSVNANNADLKFTYTGDGRMGRNLTETMVTLSEPKSIVANSAITYFKD
jgi:hypothetical protein